jgi:steroid delta-isomerase-like uncharacterized protein
MRMSSDDNKNINLRWIQAFNERDWETEAAYRAPDFVAYLTAAPGPLDNPGWAEYMSTFTTGLPDAQIAIDTSVAERDIVASRWTLTGTHSGTFHGVPATGRQVTMVGVEMSRFADGKIVEHWAQFDVLGMLQQIGGLRY